MSSKMNVPFCLWGKKFYAFLTYTMPIKYTANIILLIFVSNTTPRNIRIKKLLMIDYNFLRPFLICSLYDANIFLGVWIRKTNWMSLLYSLFLF